MQVVEKDEENGDALLGLQAHTTGFFGTVYRNLALKCDVSGQGAIAVSFRDISFSYDISILLVFYWYLLVSDLTISRSCRESRR